MSLKFLTKDGKRIYDEIKAFSELKMGLEDIDHLEMGMLANSFDLYIRCAEICNLTGVTQQPEKGGWDQVRPEYTVMKNEYSNILKHSSKFGLNPSDRDKILKSKPKQKAKKSFTV